MFLKQKAEGRDNLFVDMKYFSIPSCPCVEKEILSQNGHNRTCKGHFYIHVQDSEIFA